MPNLIDPAQALLMAAGFVALSILLVWPKTGLVARVSRVLRSNEREVIEDALKHLYDCEYVGATGTIQSLAGSLEISTSHVTKLVAQLESLGLLRTEEAGLRLTDQGREYALRVIRIHRLWETYLAERTGYDEADWHFEADRREHTTSANELDDLVRTMGDPRFDPHGDPIPTAEGEVPARRGRPLIDLPVGTVAIVVHVEDEPEAIHAQLRAQNIHPRQRLTVLERSPERIRVDLGGEEQVMAPVVAGNIWVSVVPRKAQPIPVDRLSALHIGESRAVVGISPACQGLQRRRLLDLGLVPGTEVTAVLKSPTGDPTGYRIRGAIIALRREQADLIHVQHRQHDEAVG